MNDGIEAWRRANIDEIRRHAGKSIAIHPTLGILFSDDDVLKVIEQVRASGMMRDIVIERVRRVFAVPPVVRKKENKE